MIQMSAWKTPQIALITTVAVDASETALVDAPDIWPVHRHVCGHVHRHVYRHVCKHVYRHVYRHVCGHA